MADRTIHVLLVEDNPGDAYLIRRMLADASVAGPESQPFDVTCVDTLAGGVRSVHAGKSDVVLLDLSLPDSQGLNTLTSMQAAAPAVPVVVLTGLADESAALAAVQNGAQDYLVKGHVNPNALSNSIRYARERKQLLEALRKYSASLEERNAELDAFAHTVAHDLKNQVFTVAGNAELLLDKQAPPEPQEQEEMLRDILRSAQKMSQVIQELLLLAQVRRADVATTEIDMPVVLAEARARIWSLLAETGGELIVDGAEQWPPACGYAPWVEEIWYNYISNALKYGGQPPPRRAGGRASRCTAHLFLGARQWPWAYRRPNGASLCRVHTRRRCCPGGPAAWARPGSLDRQAHRRQTGRRGGRAEPARCGQCLSLLFAGSAVRQKRKLTPVRLSRTL